jgi:hypothetical protein
MQVVLTKNNKLDVREITWFIIHTITCCYRAANPLNTGISVRLIIYTLSDTYKNKGGKHYDNLRLL